MTGRSVASALTALLLASAPGSQVLDPHTDPYDVLVWQVKGRKSWRACVPRQEIAAGKGGAASGPRDWRAAPEDDDASDEDGGGASDEDDD